ncbi:hypothetical protein IM792_09200 [Mucilaginibacter sp. JRF]|uniref:hypothetical protein n=1 Tax=Mucilaginibacter sp. JRF TaxID=2780088 RepID=UPI0018806EC6|nr:hypothetical protein [Mucilaginibacter sp. JRF]MBE9584620.1 hypothetical protein [Mucilaginibacter sp. JRF]
MTTHQLAHLLLLQKDIPVVIQSSEDSSIANFVQGAHLYQNEDSPFEYCLLISSKGALVQPNEIDVND